MNLDDLAAFKTLDTQDMLSHIESLPSQLQTAWELGLQKPLPAVTSIKQVLLAGMGGSAIGADLVAAFSAQRCRVPILVHRDYGLPAWAKGPQTLLVASSHSGDTEEALSAFEAGLTNGCSCLAIATGGDLAQAATFAGVALWTFEHSGQPRAAVGYSFGLLIAALARFDLLPNPAEELHLAVGAMRAQQEDIRPEIPAALNPAKRMAGQLVGRAVAVLGSGVLAPVARRWKCQINEIAKAWAQFELLPEADHNTLEGILNPEDYFSRMMVLFLRSPSDDPRNRLRSDLTRKTFMLEGLNTDFIDAQGKGPLSHLWTSLHLGDYVAYYLAMAYGVDPTPVHTIQHFKQQMLEAG
jgi:glucose/mannose-6-phosphate isomerase